MKASPSDAFSQVWIVHSNASSVYFEAMHSVWKNSILFRQIHSTELKHCMYVENTPKRFI